MCIRRYEVVDLKQLSLKTDTYSEPQGEGDDLTTNVYDTVVMEGDMTIPENADSAGVEYTQCAAYGVTSKALIT